MMLSESVRIFPPCEHLSGNRCEWISAKLGRLYGVSPILCNHTCKRFGPYQGKQPADEVAFLRQMWKRHSPAGDGNLLRRVLSNYNKPADVHVPEIWQSVKRDLAYLDGLPGYRGAMLTGSAILRRNSKLKDLDIVLRFDSAAKALLAIGSLPEFIDGIQTDFFFYVGENPDVYFACLDCEQRTLYVSRWMPLKIASITPGIKVVEQGTNQFGAMLESMACEQSQEDVRKARQGWQGVWREWKQLTSFVAAARSRGILATAKAIAGLGNTDGFHCDDKTLAARQSSCFGGAGKLPCPVLVENAGGHKFCGACGCGQTELARLDADKPEDYTKLHYPVLRCPLNRDGFTT